MRTVAGREVAELLDELAMHDLWSHDNSGSDAVASADSVPGTPGVSSGAPGAAVPAARSRYMPYDSGRRAELRQLVEHYLISGGADAASGSSGGGSKAEDEAEEGAAVARLRLDSVRRVREVLRACKVRVVRGHAACGQAAQPGRAGKLCLSSVPCRLRGTSCQD